MRILMHDFDRAEAEENLGTFEVVVERKLAQAKSSANHLSMLHRFTLSLLGYLAGLGKDTGRLRNVLRLLARTGAATFALARTRPGESVDVALDDDGVSRLTGPVDESTAHGGVWLFSYWAALILDDPQSLYLLSTTPVRIMRDSSTTSDPYYEMFIDALESFTNADSSVTQKLFPALQATDPAGLKTSEARYVLNIHVPQMEILYNLLKSRQEGFTSALVKALEKHKTYWERDRENTEGLFALGPAALACAAVRQGLRVEVESGYMPAGLLRPRIAEPLSLCPYCLTPAALAATLCPACAQDMSKDARIDMDREEFIAERKTCATCGTRIPKLAVTCPSCRAQQ